MAKNSDQQTQAEKLAMEIVKVGNTIQLAAQPPLENPARITRTADQGSMGIFNSNPDSLGEELKKAGVALRGIADEIDKLLGGADQ